LAINLKLFAQFAHLLGYFFKAQIAQTLNTLKMRNANCTAFKNP